MILTCPECATRYQTDASHFTPDGRKVRCAKCGHVWFQAAPQPEVEATVDHVPEQPAQHQAEAAPVIPQRDMPVAPAVAAPRTAPAQPLERVGLGVGWAALALIVVAIGWSAVRYRQDIASLWPQSSSLYAGLGMPVNTRGLEFRDKNAHFESEDGQDVLVISGDLVNITSHELSVPSIRVSLTDEDKRELYHWFFSAGVATLHPGQLAAFHTRLPSPPATARHIDLSFAERAN
jgi:predicted Zn finger-like uncharacterized protein